MKSFLKTIVDHFDIGPATGHVAIVSYSSDPKLELKFNDLRGPQLNNTNVKNYIDKMFHQRGFTFIDRALVFALNKVFVTRNGMRPNVPQVRKTIWILLHLIHIFSFKEG